MNIKNTPETPENVLAKIINTPYDLLKSKWKKFVKIAKPDTKTGCSDWIRKSELPVELMFDNGGSWFRSDTKSKLHDSFIFEQKKEGNEIIAIRLNGFNFQKKNNQQTIRPDIRVSFKDAICSISGTGHNVELDHRAGAKNDARLSDLSKQTREDFQPLSKHNNDVKRQRCKECQNNNKRFSAKVLGHQLSFVNGSYMLNVNDVEKTCLGCLWHGPKEFIFQEITLCYKYIKEAVKLGLIKDDNSNRERDILFEEIDSEIKENQIDILNISDILKNILDKRVKNGTDTK